LSIVNCQLLSVQIMDFPAPAAVKLVTGERDRAAGLAPYATATFSE
jgi:hypothetical protein